MARPSRLPEPTSDLHERKLTLREMQGPWLRIHQHPDPLHFGRTGENRFDDPLGRYGVLYAACRLSGAFSEVLGRRTLYQTITLSALQRSQVSQLIATEAARLVDLTGAGPRRLGADSRLCNGPHGIAQQWSRALHEHPERPDGLYYRLRLDSSQSAMALFERFQPRLLVDSTTPLLFHPGLRAALKRYGMSILA